MPTFLHVGCGQSRKENTTRGFNTPEWREVRLDIEPAVKPDIVADMTDMGAVADASMGAVFSSHNLEHLYWHEVAVALREFHRVLEPNGFLVLTCPDLQSIGVRLAEGKLLEPAYESASGPIAPVDMLYGLRPALARGAHFMAHKSGFTAAALQQLLKNAGFASSAVWRREPAYDLWVVAAKTPCSNDALKALAFQHFPGRAPAPGQDQEQRA